MHNMPYRVSPVKDTQAGKSTRRAELQVLNIVQPYTISLTATRLLSCASKEQRVLGLVEADLRLSSLTTASAAGHRDHGICACVFCRHLRYALHYSLEPRSTPLTLLSQGMRKVASGDLDHKIEINRSDEIGNLQTLQYHERRAQEGEERADGLGNTLEKKSRRRLSYPAGTTAARSFRKARIARPDGCRWHMRSKPSYRYCNFGISS